MPNKTVQIPIPLCQPNRPIFIETFSLFFPLSVASKSRENKPPWRGIWESDDTPRLFLRGSQGGSRALHLSQNSNSVNIPAGGSKAPRIQGQSFLH